mmetsp:Transcript_13628/g.26180  ORF Transcript_13628/g.26180 Transcript_13628/m.26180 type:complete len:213 (+) Transcript_13628:66-704(+)
MHPVHVFPVSPFVWKPVVLHSPQTVRRRAQARRMHVVSPSCALTRRVVLNTVLGVVITGVSPFANAADRNDAIMKSLRDLKQKQAVEDGQVLSRLRKAQAQLERSKLLADAGEYDNARQLLRGGSVDTIRDDLKKAETYLAAVRPTFDVFEETALIGALEAFDNAMRLVIRGSKEVTAADVQKDGEMMLLAMSEVIMVIDRAKADYNTPEPR